MLQMFVVDHWLGDYFGLSVGYSYSQYNSLVSLAILLCIQWTIFQALVIVFARNVYPQKSLIVRLLESTCDKESCGYSLLHSYDKRWIELPRFVVTFFGREIEYVVA